MPRRRQPENPRVSRLHPSCRVRDVKRKIFSKWILVGVLALVFGGGVRTQAQNSTSSGCLTGTASQVKHDGVWVVSGIVKAPRNAVRLSNLKWELPVAAGTAALIAEGDAPASRRIHSLSLQHDADRASSLGLYTLLGASAMTYLVGCAGHRDYARETGLTALEAAGTALGLDGLLKRATNRRRPDLTNESESFWDGGNSFASGHAAASFAIASVIAHRYPHKRWAKWGAYGLATGISMARFAAKKHFLSDIVVGSTLGYVTGTYLASPHE